MTITNWDPKAAVHLQQKMRGIKQVQLLVEGLEDLIAEERLAYFKHLGQLIGKAPDRICVGARPCKRSPTGTCVYEYVAEDVCLFCGQTNELKK